jgi:predicted short-subunit dehydrogenase-like oxidoreductase (DUF2520 family)
MGLAIVGPGRIGQALGKLLRGRGVPVRWVAGRNLARAKRAARFIGGARAVGLEDAALGTAGVILLTVSDAAIEPVARRLAKLRKDWTGRIVLHTCGSVPASALEAFRRRGAAIGSLHPYQTVPNRKAGARSLENCFWAVEGDAAAERLSRQWVKKLGGKAFSIRPKRKPLYHLSAFLVCPTALALMDAAEKLLRKAGIPNAAIRPMLAQFAAETAANFGRFGGRKALTGPVVRGDWATIRKHLAELRRTRPDAVPAYRELVRLMARLAGRPIPAGGLDSLSGGSSRGCGRPR